MATTRKVGLKANGKLKKGFLAKKILVHSNIAR